MPSRRARAGVWAGVRQIIAGPIRSVSRKGGLYMTEKVSLIVSRAYALA